MGGIIITETYKCGNVEYTLEELLESLHIMVELADSTPTKAEHSYIFNRAYIPMLHLIAGVTGMRATDVDMAEYHTYREYHDEIDRIEQEEHLAHLAEMASHIKR